MQRILFILALGIITSCHSSKKSTAPVNAVEKTVPSLLEGNWQLTMLFASDNKWGKVPVMNFDVKENTFSGNSGCNSIRGRFTMDKSFINIDKNIMSTKMACADANGNRREKEFLSALQKITTWTINKDELELGQGVIVLMKFKRS